MSQTLRPYQQSAVNSVFDSMVENYRRILYCMACGCGKTTTFAEIVRLADTVNNWRVLVLVDNMELVTQAYNRIKDHCGYDCYQIGIEQAGNYAGAANRCVVGTMQTVRNENRLSDWKPDLIITDEAHVASAKSFQRIYERFGVGKPDGAWHIGCTATPKRTDKQSLYAKNPDGSPVIIYDPKTSANREAAPDESVFEIMCSDFAMADAIEEGWLVDYKGKSFEGVVDLSGVKTCANDKTGESDFVESQLKAKLEESDDVIVARLNKAFEEWEKIAPGRPTVVFCPGVETAHWGAKIWADNGYPAVAIDGETDKDFERPQAFKDFTSGKVKALFNYGVITKGTDLPTCSCIVHLRPTKSWTLFMQMTGRGSRALPGVLKGLENAEPEARRAAIQASAKPDCLVIDFVENTGKHEVCSLPSILDLPASLDLEGHSVSEMKKMLAEFEEVKGQVIGECPKSFTKLAGRLRDVEMLRKSAAKTKDVWSVTDRGYTFNKTPPGYHAELLSTAPGEFRLIVRYAQETLIDKNGKSGMDFKNYLDKAIYHAKTAIAEHGEVRRAAMPAVSRGTLARLQACGTGGWYRTMRARKHTDTEIDAMPFAKAKAMAQKYSEEYHSRR